MRSFDKMDFLLDFLVCPNLQYEANLGMDVFNSVKNTFMFSDGLVLFNAELVLVFEI